MFKVSSTSKGSAERCGKKAQISENAPLRAISNTTFFAHGIIESFGSEGASADHLVNTPDTDRHIYH